MLILIYSIDISVLLVIKKYLCCGKSCNRLVASFLQVEEGRVWDIVLQVPGRKGKTNYYRQLINIKDKVKEVKE